MSEDFGNGALLISLVLLFFIFLVIRELICWYFKFNEMLSVQKEILSCLKKEERESEEIPTETTEKSYAEYLAEEQDKNSKK